MFKVVLMMVLLFPVVCFAAPKKSTPSRPSKPSSPAVRTTGRSSFYGPSGRREYDGIGSGTTKRYFTPGGKYLGKEVQYPK